MTAKNFEDLRIWQQAKQIALLIYDYIEISQKATTFSQKINIFNISIL